MNFCKRRSCLHSQQTRGISIPHFSRIQPTISGVLGRVKWEEEQQFNNMHGDPLMQKHKIPQKQPMLKLWSFIKRTDATTTCFLILRLKIWAPYLQPPQLCTGNFFFLNMAETGNVKYKDSLHQQQEERPSCSRHLFTMQQLLWHNKKERKVQSMRPVFIDYCTKHWLTSETSNIQTR